MGAELPFGEPLTGRNPLIVAVDTSDGARAESLAVRLGGMVAFLKVGLELFTAEGPPVVARLATHQADIWRL